MAQNKNQKLELTWIGKGEEPRLEPRILIEQPEYSYWPGKEQGKPAPWSIKKSGKSNNHENHGSDNFSNMLIHGDNLLALKALEQDYAGKIKCIYIDPPFNTGAAFEHYDDGIEHSAWIDLMFRRLLILKSLLSKDGVIFVHIDDKEMAYLRIMMDEIFERRNFLNMMVIKTSDPSGHKVVNPSPYSQTEYLLMYSKDRFYYKYDIQYVPSEYDTMYNKIVTNIDDHYENWNIENLNDYYAKLCGFKDTKSARKSKGKLDFEKEVSQFAEKNSKRVFQSTAISNAAGRSIVELRDESKLNPNKVYYFPREDYEDIYILNGRQMYFIESKIKEIEGVFQIAKPLTNLWTDIPYNGIANEGQVSFKNGKKPEKLIKRCIEISSNVGDIILDSFLGSGTTAAVAHKMGRRWIGVELGEHAKTHCVPRMKQVIEGEQGGISKALNWKGGGGFKFYTLASSLLNKDKFDNWVISAEYNAQMLAAAMAKQEGFRYNPHETTYWKQGNSSENDYIFTTTQFVTVESLDQIHDEMLPGESLLICCKAFQKECKSKYTNITIKKIPQMLLGRCEFGKEDYSLNIVNLPVEEDDMNDFLSDTTVSEPTEIKPDKRSVQEINRNNNQPTLFD
ncbi:MAG TPA: site-specific DNA-methyltransferase [Bacteroidales bacterium]|nr:site-specific DNA-methyltransferase [Bacteroidales bacterium]